MPTTPPPSRSRSQPRTPAAILGLVTACYTLVLVFATHYPKPEELLGPNAPSDKTLHFIAYGLLGLLAAATLAANGTRSGRIWLALAAALAVFGVADEATQPLFARAADPIDWVYDCIGITCGITAVVVFMTIWRRA